MRGQEYRDVALDAARWVLGATVPVAGGRALLAGDEPEDNLYNGGAGLLALAAEAALDGVRLPVDEVRDRVAARAAGPDDDGLHRGVAGYGAGLLGYAEATGDPVARAGVAAAVARLSDTWTGDGWPPPAVYAGRGVYLDVISGAAGMVLFLVRAGTPAALALAERAADLLVRYADRTDAGLDWAMVPGHAVRMPGFSHGTAGCATAVALAGHVLGRADLLAAARAGADHLCSLARPGPGFTVPNAVPPAEDIEPVSYGWCHGVVGTVRLFWVLGDLATVDAGLLAARRSGLPRRLRPGFWDNLGRCCGSAGVGEAVLDRYQQTGDPELLAFADELARDILDRAERDDDGTRWRFTEHADGEERLMRPEAGWMQGAAGIAAYLLRLHRVHRDGPAATRLAWPETPVDTC